MEQQGTATREARLAEAFVSLADSLVSDYEVVELVHTLIDQCVDLLDITAAGLVLRDRDGELEVLASSSEQGELIEVLQLREGEGPCVQCYVTGQVVSIGDIAAGVPWPAFQAAAAEQGFRSVHAVPMRLREQTVGALNLFGARPGTLGVADARAAQALADVATIAILQERALRQQTVVSDQLQGALTSRITIEQAKGVLSHQHGLDMDAAFTLLRGHARATHQRLLAVADAVIAGTVQLSPSAAATTAVTTAVGVSEGSSTTPADK